MTKQMWVCLVAGIAIGAIIASCLFSALGDTYETKPYQGSMMKVNKRTGQTWVFTTKGQWYEIKNSN